MWDFFGYSTRATEFWGARTIRKNLTYIYWSDKIREYPKPEKSVFEIALVVNTKQVMHTGLDTSTQYSLVCIFSIFLCSEAETLGWVNFFKFLLQCLYCVEFFILIPKMAFFLLWDEYPTCTVYFTEDLFSGLFWPFWSLITFSCR